MKEVMEPHRYCDVCGDEINIGLTCHKANCMYCKKDLCETCVGNEHDTPGDYRSVYCKQCWKLGEGYRPEIEKLHNKIEQLYQEWQDKCKKNI